MLGSLTINVLLLTQLLPSSTKQVYSPGGSSVGSIPNHVSVYGGVPPLICNSIFPSSLPLQLTLLIIGLIITSLGCVINAVSVIEQLFESVTVTM